MRPTSHIVTGVSLAYVSLVAAAPQQLNFNQITAAPTVANGPTDNGIGIQTASLITTFSSPTAVTAAATGAVKVREVEVPAPKIAKRNLLYSLSQTITSYAAGVGQSSVTSTIIPGILYWLSGQGAHTITGNLDNSGNLVISQTNYLKSYINAAGQTCNWAGHDSNNGNLINRAGGSIQLNDIGAASAPTYNWNLHSILNNGTFQMCGRGDTGGGTYQLWSDLDANNNGLISFEQVSNNDGSAFTWRNTNLTTSNCVNNLYNNGAFRLINTVFQNVQNVYGSGCWQVGKGAVLYLQSGTGQYQNPTNGPSFPGQSITFQDSSAVLHMDSGVYSKNSNFGAKVYGFTSGNAFEFSELVWTYSYSTTSGLLSVKMWSGNTVSINIGLGYTASKFYLSLNPSKYNLLGYNAIFYSGTCPSQSTPSQCAITASVCQNLASTAPCASATGYVTVTSTAPATASLTTKTVQPSGTVSGTLIVITPSAASFVTSTTTGPVGGTLMTTTVLPSGTIAGTVIVITPSASPSFVTTTTTGQVGGTLTTTTVSPSGSNPGTVIVVTPSAPSYNTTTSTAPYGVSLTTTTVAPSGTAMGTVIVISPSISPSFVTTTTTAPYGVSPSTTTVSPIGTTPGTVVVITPSTPVYVTTTTLISYVPYSDVSTTTVAAPSGSVPGTVVIISPSAYTPYYPAIATGYTTDPALTATTSAGQACPTTPEAGTYCGFINPEDPCAPQPDGYGPVPTPDTASAFLAYPSFSSMAYAAPTVIPSTNGSEYIQTFVDENAATSAQSYLGLITLESYSPAECAAACDVKDLCTSFNIFVQRDPSLNPATNASSSEPSVWGYNCPNPASMTSFKCTLWGSEIDNTTATNSGQWRVNFQTVITASNGYDKTNSSTPVISGGSSSSSSATSATSTWSKSSATTLVTVTSSTGASTTASTTPSASTSTSSCTWSPPTNCHTNAISAPSHWLGSQFFPGPFNPTICSLYAQSQNSANQQAALAAGSASYAKCQMFNGYYIHRNGAPAGTVCSLYDAVLDASWATYGGGVSAGGYRYECRQSWTWSLVG